MNCKFQKFPLLPGCYSLAVPALSLKKSLYNFLFFFYSANSCYISKFNIFKGFDILHNINIIILLTNLTFKEPLGRSRMNIESMKAKKRVVKLITIVILIFTICWLPLQVSHTSVIAGFLWSLNPYNISSQH